MYSVGLHFVQEILPEALAEILPVLEVVPEILPVLDVVPEALADILPVLATTPSWPFPLLPACDSGRLHVSSLSLFTEAEASNLATKMKSP